MSVVPGAGDTIGGGKALVVLVLVAVELVLVVLPPTFIENEAWLTNQPLLFRVQKLT